MADTARIALPVRAYLAAMALAAPFARRHLRARLGRGKEDPERWHEKRGVASASRPEGPVIWLHAVGVGEVLALPGLARALRAARPDTTVLITSSSRTSAEALAPNLPEGAIHQFLPLDIPRWGRRFLDHWRPALSVWAERDIWPGLIVETNRREIPLALVNGRMDAASYRAKAKAAVIFRDLYRRFEMIEVQDKESARHFVELGADPRRVSVTGSLKTAAPPLADLPERAAVEQALGGRRVWLAASTHPGEEPEIAHAHRLLLASDPSVCLVLAPRDPARAEDARRCLARLDIDAEILPHGNLPLLPAQAYVVPRIGELGLWYRVADTAFVGGSLVPVGGHNPWEAARLDCAILHGPQTQNFTADYARMAQAEAAREVLSGEEIATALTDPSLAGMRTRAARLSQAQGHLAAEMAERLLAHMEHK